METFEGMKYSERSGLPGMWSWPDLWWKSKCGCMGYGRIQLYDCNTKMIVFNASVGLDTEKLLLGVSEVSKLDTHEKGWLIGKVNNELMLSKKAREILLILQKIGKLVAEK